MSAYKKKLVKKCVTCKNKNAIFEVYNKANISQGKFCLLCADNEVKFLDRTDKGPVVIK